MHELREILQIAGFWWAGLWDDENFEYTVLGPFVSEEVAKNSLRAPEPQGYRCRLPESFFSQPA